jgi:hypothetical protein
MEVKMRSPAAGEDLSRLYYQYASALYNMSYYGNTWQAMANERSGSNWNYGNYKQLGRRSIMTSIGRETITKKLTMPLATKNLRQPAYLW